MQTLTSADYENAQAAITWLRQQGYTVTKRTAKRAATIKPLSEMSDKELRDYYKRIAAVEDVKFQLRIPTLSARVRAGYVALLETLEANGGKATPETKREYLRLQALWRQDSSDGHTHTACTCQAPDVISTPYGAAGACSACGFTRYAPPPVER